MHALASEPCVLLWLPAWLTDAEVNEVLQAYLKESTARAHLKLVYTYAPDGGRVSSVKTITTRPIRAGEEVLTDYGATWLPMQLYHYKSNLQVLAQLKEKEKLLKQHWKGPAEDVDDDDPLKDLKSERAVLDARIKRFKDMPEEDKLAMEGYHASRKNLEEV